MQITRNRDEPLSLAVIHSLDLTIYIRSPLFEHMMVNLLIYSLCKSYSSLPSSLRDMTVHSR